MKRLLTIHLIMLCAIAAWSQTPVAIPDPNLEQAIRDQLDLSSDRPVLDSDMRRLTRLDAAERGITDITGLEHARHLHALYLFSNPIPDISPLASLTGLTRLHLVDCGISDIRPLAGLTRLTYLVLKYNRIEDIRPLANLTQLRELFLSHNRIADVRPLAGLTRLELLQIEHNRITDHRPLDGLALDVYTYDQSCDMPPLPIEHRILDRDFPSVFAAWWWQLDNRPDLSRLEQITRHDLYFDSWFGLAFRHTDHGVAMTGHLDEAIRERDEFLASNPNMIFLIAVNYRDAYAAGNPVLGWEDSYLVDFTQSGAQDLVVDRSVAVSRCGLYDGIFLDWWSENGSVLRGHRSVAEEVRAKEIIVRRIREATRPGFLIMVNNNRRQFPITAPYINGTFMESGTPGGFSGDPAEGEQLERQIYEMESTLRWAEETLQTPRINALEAWGIGSEPPDSPVNLRWMRTFTALSLTHSDGYTLISEGDAPGQVWSTHRHYWYDFWDADLGRSVGPKYQLYHETPGLYIREFANGWAVYNHSGEMQQIRLPEPTQSASTGQNGGMHELPNLDGGIYLKAGHPADANRDGVISILDLVLVANAIGSADAAADINRDGVVNVFDLVMIANEL